MAGGRRVRAGRGLALGQRKVNLEGGAAVETAALRQNGPAVHLYELLRDGEAEAETGMAAAPGRVALRE